MQYRSDKMRIEEKTNNKYRINTRYGTTDSLDTFSNTNRTNDPQMKDTDVVSRREVCSDQIQRIRIEQELQLEDINDKIE